MKVEQTGRFTLTFSVDHLIKRFFTLNSYLVNSSDYFTKEHTLQFSKKVIKDKPKYYIITGAIECYMLDMFSDFCLNLYKYLYMNYSINPNIYKVLVKDSQYSNFQILIEINISETYGYCYQPPETSTELLQLLDLIYE